MKRQWCGLHGMKRCECADHCSGCRHSYGPHQDDCCTCCRPPAASK